MCFGNSASLPCPYAKGTEWLFLDFHMPIKKSVTSHIPRNVTDNHHWAEKLDPEAIAFLDAYRMARSNYRPPPTKIEDLPSWLKQFAEAASGFPKDPASLHTRTVTVEKKFLDLLSQGGPPFADMLKEGENALAPGLAMMVEAAQTCALLFEAAPNVRLGVYFAIGLAYRLGRPLWDRLRFEQFGKDPLDQQKIETLAAMGLEFVAGLLRGQWKKPKGRINPELIEIINLIQRYSAIPLRPSEIRVAVLYAGINVPDEDTWRVWLHRARKRKLVETQRVPPREIEIPVNEDGSLDLASLDADTMRSLRRAVRKLQA